MGPLPVQLRVLTAMGLGEGVGKGGGLGTGLGTGLGEGMGDGDGTGMGLGDGLGEGLGLGDGLGLGLGTGESEGEGMGLAGGATGEAAAALVDGGATVLPLEVVLLAGDAVACVAMGTAWPRSSRAASSTVASTRRWLSAWGAMAPRQGRAAPCEGAEAPV